MGYVKVDECTWDERYQEFANAVLDPGHTECSIVRMWRSNDRCMVVFKFRDGRQLMVYGNGTIFYGTPGMHDGVAITLVPGEPGEEIQ